MVGFKQTFCALLLITFAGVAIAQNNTNSPYTRYGFGDLSDQTFGNSKGMGGIAFGLRDGMQINALNPASYTAIDSLTFLFDGGLSLQNMNLNNNGVKMNVKNSSLDYLAMQFRLRSWIAMSVGLLPYSNIGYNVSESIVATESTPDHTKSYSGDGGMRQLYAGLGIKVLKNLSLGANVSYFWGDLTRSLTVIYPSTDNAFSYAERTNVSVSDYKIDLGAQYTQKINKKLEMTLGAVYSPKHNLSNKTTTDIQVSSVTTTNVDASFALPESFGAGLTFNYDKRLTIGADYSVQRWSKVKYMNDENAFVDRTKIAVGAEYIPSLIGRSYLSHIKYRIGAFYSNPYYKIGKLGTAKEYGVTAGFGLPLPRSRSIISLSGQFVHRNGLDSNLIDENVFRLSIGITFNENWFVKRKVK